MTAAKENQNFNGKILTYMVSGSITSKAAGVPGVKLVGLPGNVVTGDKGQYTATVEYGFSGTVTPTKEGFNFNSTQQGL